MISVFFQNQILFMTHPLCYFLARQPHMSHVLQIVSTSLPQKSSSTPTYLHCGWSFVRTDVRLRGVWGWVYSHCLQYHPCFLSIVNCLRLSPNSVGPHLLSIYLCIFRKHSSAVPITWPTKQRITYTWRFRFLFVDFSVKCEIFCKIAHFLITSGNHKSPFDFIWLDLRCTIKEVIAFFVHFMLEELNTKATYYNKIDRPILKHFKLVAKHLESSSCLLNICPRRDNIPRFVGKWVAIILKHLVASFSSFWLSYKLVI